MKKYRRIYFGGGSDVNGAELGTVWEDRLPLRFSRLVSDHFDAKEYNISHGGASNHRIVRELLMSDIHISKFDAAVIQMTPMWRTEYHSGDNWERVGVPSNGKTGDCRSPSKWWLENKLTSQKVEGDFWRNYFRIHSEEFFLTNEKMYHTTIKSHCKAYGVPLILLGRRLSSDLEFDFCFDDSWISKAPKGHPNEEGHKAIADRIISMLTKHK